MTYRFQCDECELVKENEQLRKEVRRLKGAMQEYEEILKSDDGND